MKKKPIGESADMQRRLDHFVNDLDHLDESLAGPDYEPALDDHDDGGMSWLQGEDDAMQQESPMGDYSADLFEDGEPARRPFKFLFGLFSVSATLILALLWFLWPDTGVNNPELQSVTQGDSGGMSAAVAPVASLHVSDDVSMNALTDSPVVPVESDVAVTEDVAAVAVLPEAVTRAPEVTKATPLPVTTAKVAEAAISSEDIRPVAGSDVERDVQKNLLKIGVHLGLIRDAPGPQGKVIARLKKGTVVLTLYREGDWYRVRFPDDREAWAHQSIF